MSVTLDEIKEPYQAVSSIIAEEQYLAAVQDKVETMAGLCDAKTAALLVNNDLGVNEAESTFEPVKISELNSGDVAAIVATIINIGPVREFNRTDGSQGKVTNIAVGDETGTISLSIWDDMTDMFVNGTFKVDSTIEVTGNVQEGPTGLSINVGKNDSIRHSDEVVSATLPIIPIEKIKDKSYNIFVEGKVLNIGQIRTFNKNDGSEGKVGNFTIGDDTGKIVVTVWNEKTEFLDTLDIDENLLLKNVNAKYNDYSKKVELQFGDSSIMETSQKDINYTESFTAIDQLEVGSMCSVKGNVIDIGPIREITKDDGLSDVVGNIQVKDDSGEVRVVLWGSNTELMKTMSLTTPISIIDAFVKMGYDQTVELSLTKNSSISLV
jgi:replication factor A1